MDRLLGLRLTVRTARQVKTAVAALLVSSCSGPASPGPTTEQDQHPNPAADADLISDPVTGQSLPSAAARSIAVPGVDKIQSRISIGQYAIRLGQGGLDAPNRALGVRARWTAQGLELTPREAAITSATLSFRTVGASRGDREQAFAGADFVIGRCRSDGEVDEVGKCLRRAEAHRGDIVEWWENRPDGMEHGFEIPRKMLDRGATHAPLRIVVSFGGVAADVDAEGRQATLRGPVGSRFLYTDAAAHDREGHALPVKLISDVRGVAIEVDDRTAVYPIEVDPIVKPSVWSVDDSNNSGSLFGWNIVSAGDVNGDGYGDVAVGAHFFDNGQNNEGKAFVYHGGPNGLASTAAWQKESNLANSRYGLAIVALNANGDQYGDLAVSAPDISKVWLYLGSATGLSTTPSTWSYTAPGTTFGFSLGSADVNGDGRGDLLVGDYDASFTNPATHGGRVLVFHGQAGSVGLATTPAATVGSDQDLAQFGVTVAGAKDVNKDGFEDIVVGAGLYDNGEFNEGKAFLYYGSSSGLNTTPHGFGETNQANANLGRVASVGDVDADGYADVVVTSLNYASGEGRAWLFRGGSGTSGFGSASWTFGSGQAGAALYFAAGAGDVNGDGRGDILLGAPMYNGGSAFQGRAWLFFGESNAQGVHDPVSWTLTGDQANAWVGPVSGAGDVNKDGFGDFMVGAYHYSAGTADEGRAYVFQADTSHTTNLVPFVRLHCPDVPTGYFYTELASEKNATITSYRCWSMDQVLGYVAPSQTAETFPLYRLRTPSHSYFLTPLPAERDAVQQPPYNFVYERIVGYVFGQQLPDTWGLRRMRKPAGNYEYVFVVDLPNIVSYWQSKGFVDEGITTFISKSSKNPAYGIDWPRADAPAVRGDLMVGAVYHPGFDHVENDPVPASANDWRFINRPYTATFPPNSQYAFFNDPTKKSWVGRKPKLGWYNGASPKVLDWEVKWALEHGVQFFMINWFRNRFTWTDIPPTCTGDELQGDAFTEILDNTRVDGFLQSQFKDTFQFAINWDNDSMAGLSRNRCNPDKVEARRQLLDVYYPYWRANLFTKPQYLRIGGKPVLYVFRYYIARNDFQGDKAAMASALQALKDKAFQDNMSGLIVVCGDDGAFSQASLQDMKDSGCDATFTYYVYAHAQPNPPTPTSAYSDFVAYNTTLINGQNILPGHLTPSVGWNNQPVGQPPYPDPNVPLVPAPVWWLEPTLSGAGNSYDDELQWLNSNIANAPTINGRKLVMLDAWNEWVEGHYISPTEKYGFKYLNTVRQSLAAPLAASTRDVAPTGADLTALQSIWCGAYPSACPYACNDTDGDGVCTGNGP
jgi:hypothetical protein